MDKKMILKVLNKTECRYLNLTDTEKNEIADNMIAVWVNINNPFDLNDLSKEEYEKKMDKLKKCFALYFADEKVRKKIVKKIYDELFDTVEESDKPFLAIAIGPIASGKSTVIECIIPEKYGECGKDYAIVDKDVIKSSNIFRDYIHGHFGDAHGNIINDLMLNFRDEIGKEAIGRGKSMVIEQSCKSETFLVTCENAKNKGFEIFAEIVMTPLALTCLRNVYRFLTGLIENPSTARYESLENIKVKTYNNAVNVLTQFQDGYFRGEDTAKRMTVYTSDVLKVDVAGKKIGEVFDEVTNSFSDISVEIATKMHEFIYANIDLLKNNPDWNDIESSLSITEQKLDELAKNPGMIKKALPQDDQFPSVRKKLDELNAPFGYSYSDRLLQNKP